MDDLRGIMRPAAVGKVFTLERPAPPSDLAHLIDRHWIVRWDMRGRAPYRSEVVPHPAVHLVFETGAALVYGVQRARDVRILSGLGWAVGTKFLPGGFAGFTQQPIADLTDSRRPLAAIFGAPGAELARAAEQEDAPAGKLALLHAFLRERLPAPHPEIALVQIVVAEMRDAPPGARVDQLAGRHHISTRTLQRLFRRHVGVTPQWVLKRYRIHLALERLDLRDGADWSRMARELGYFDHAHFIRDFRSVVGRSPARYERETLAWRST